jgi:hypothetical protein
MGLGAAGTIAAVGATAAVAGAGVQVAGALKGSSAISQGQQQANAAVQPWVTSGTAANTQQANLLGLNGQPSADAAMKSFQASPGYGYQVQQGLQAVDAGAASRGTLVSGSTIKGEETLGSNLANQDFGAYMGRLNSLSTLGQNSGVNQAGTDTSAAGAQANIAGNTATGLSNTLSSFAGNSNVQNALSSAFKPSGGTDGTGASSAFNEVQTSSPIGNTAANGLQVGGV